ncbi:MAG: serine hydrolase [Candidatus Saccharibacteria bacterium]|nr:serine hydrolase [Candidatus Saccharibacteria bacterium]
MTLVMDGVRRTTVVPLPAMSVQAMPRINARPAAAQRYVVGMDGIRRPVPLTPRDMLVNMEAPAVAAEAPVVMAEAAALATPAWRLPSLRLPQIDWKRPAVAFSLIATAVMVSAFGYQAMSTPKSVASTTVSAPAPVKSVAPAVAPAPVKEGLQKLIDDFAAANGGSWGIVVKDLKTGQTASYQPDAQFTSASLYKLFVAQRIYQRIDIGQLTYGSPAGGGTGKNVEQCLTVMINISDNPCGRALGTMVGWGKQNQSLEQEGYVTTDLSTPQKTSAADVARLYDRLYGGTLLSPNSSTRFMDLLKSQRVNNRLPVGLPSGTVIAHKTGDLDGVTHDAGIVFGPKTDYLVVVTSGPWQAPATAAPKMANLSQQLWNFFEN